MTRCLPCQIAAATPPENMEGLVRHLMSHAGPCPLVAAPSRRAEVVGAPGFGGAHDPDGGNMTATSGESVPARSGSEHGGFFAELAEHDPCRWEQVGPCVYCADHNVRLYQGSLPDARRTTPKCVEHRWDDANSMSQAGFYFLCLDCGAQEWTE